ncbi:MAG: hypothetical protein HOZ81_04905 [Streptomyces sp.]|nr:hypothetical protein [Streptomyces sp.]
MNDFLNTLAWLVGVACLIWVAVAVSQRIDRHFDQQRISNRIQARREGQ